MVTNLMINFKISNFFMKKRSCVIATQLRPDFMAKVRNVYTRTIRM